MKPHANLGASSAPKSREDASTLIITVKRARRAFRKPPLKSARIDCTIPGKASSKKQPRSDDIYNPVCDEVPTKILNGPNDGLLRQSMEKPETAGRQVFSRESVITLPAKMASTYEGRISSPQTMSHKRCRFFYQRRSVAASVILRTESGEQQTPR